MDAYEVMATTIDKIAPRSVSSFLLAILAGLAFVSLVAFKWKRRNLEKLGTQLPGPRAFPIIGNGLDFIGNPEDILTKIVKMCDTYDVSPFRVWLGPLLMVIISKPDDLQIVLNSSKTLAKGPMYRFFRNTVGTGLFSAPVEKWRRNRKVIAPAFNTRLIEQFIPVFNQQNQVLVNKTSSMLGKGMFDVWDLVSPATLDIICQTALGINVGAQDDPHSEFATALPRASELDYMRIFKFWLHPDFIFERVSYAQELKQIYKQLHGLPNAIIKQKKEEYRLKKEARLLNPTAENLEDNVGDSKNLKVFVDILLELSDAGANFSDDDLRDEIVTMMIGGSETSALGDCFCILMLAIHQDIQAKVYEEAYRIFGDSDREVTMDDLNEMVYLDMVLKETLRMYPVGPMFLRQAQEDLPLTTCTLPAGCIVVVAPFKLHKRPELYPNPYAFNPDHFLPENVAKRHRYSYIPFSGGPRGCIGSKYAMLSMKTTISYLVRNYHFSTDVKMEDIKLRVDLLLRSVNGFNVRIEPRNSNVK